MTASGGFRIVAIPGGRGAGSRPTSSLAGPMPAARWVGFSRH
jgi:hypothetical protein